MSIQHGFTGEPTDANGLVYLRNRYYNPNIGTMISRDAYAGNPNDPMSLNRYAYVHGNPVNNVDPSGMSPNCNQHLDEQDFQAYLDCLSCPTTTEIPLVSTPTPTPTPLPTPTPTPAPTSGIPNLFPPFGAGTTSVVITAYGTEGTVAFPNGRHDAIDIVPSSAYSGAIDANTCPPLDWANNQQIRVYAGVSGRVVNCDNSRVLIRTDDESYQIEYTHVNPSVSPCNGSSASQVNRGDVIGTLADPDNDPNTNTLTHLDIAVRDRTGRVVLVNPTNNIGSIVERDGFGQCN